MEATKKILIIDDEVDLTQMIGYQFSARGFEVHTANDGVEGLQKIGAVRPDLIILDINMPRMGGIELYSKICGPNGKPLYPVLVLTARANIQGLFQDLHIDGFMIKPFEIDDLVHEAEVIIKKKNQTNSNGTANKDLLIQKVCIVEDDQTTFTQMSGLFLNEGYTIIPARSGSQAIEKMMIDVPDTAVVHLGLIDIPGDTVIFRLSQMSKTMDVKFILYTSRTAKHDRVVMDRISSKTGIWTFVEYNELKEVLDVVKKI